MTDTKDIKLDIKTNFVQTTEKKTYQNGLILESSEPNDLNEDCYSNCLSCLGCFFGCMGTSCCCCCAPYKTVKQNEKGIITKFGKFKGLATAGLHYINPCTEKLETLNVSIKTLDLSSQSVLTKDNLTIQIDSVLNCQIKDVYKAHFEVSNVWTAISEFSLTTFRTIIGEKTLQDCLENREQLTNSIKDHIVPKALEWGLVIDSLLIKDISVSKDLQQALSAAAIAKRTAESRIILAQADVDSANLMRKAADILDSKAAMQIRQLETIASLAKSNNSKLIFMSMNEGIMSRDDDHAMRRDNKIKNLVISNELKTDP